MEKKIETYSVQDFDDEIVKLYENYIKGKSFLEIKHFLKVNKEFEVYDVIMGIWYYYVIWELPSNTYSIWGYLDKYINLEEFLYGKISIIKTWSLESIFEYFNNHLISFVKNEKLGEIWKIESSLLTMSARGRELIKNLHNDEKKLIAEKNRELAYNNEILVKDIEEKTYLLDKDEIDRLIETVKKNPKRCTELSECYEFIAENYKGYKRKNGQPHYSKIAEFIYKKINKKVALTTIKKQIQRFRDKNIEK
ncbi:MAG TPA: hypothetical protein PK605_05285 [Ignavibacteria bacterium]|nr:hypothetical protein [Bacteroidota bacterium]HCN38320.1 hypothetical protein [Bacteroidota bacterium]HRF66834.1 hypothetical protein [Ignavibacteria bacterium]HRJ03797.1 hypothetical protein [Ignavibacteria bacterium]